MEKIIQLQISKKEGEEIVEIKTANLTVRGYLKTYIFNCDKDKAYFSVDLNLIEQDKKD